jgi:hypothetical protein
MRKRTRDSGQEGVARRQGGGRDEEQRQTHHGKSALELVVFCVNGDADDKLVITTLISIIIVMSITMSSPHKRTDWTPLIQQGRQRLAQRDGHRRGGSQPSGIRPLLPLRRDWPSPGWCCGRSKPHTDRLGVIEGRDPAAARPTIVTSIGERANQDVWIL